MLRFVVAAIAFVLIGGFAGGTASAKSCRDAHGKFIKCAAPMTPATKHCRDAKGKFIKCSPTKTM